MSYRHNGITIHLVDEREMPECMKKPEGRKEKCLEMSVQEPGTRHKDVFTAVFRAICKHLQETCCVKVSGELMACLSFSGVL